MVVILFAYPLRCLNALFSVASTMSMVGIKEERSGGTVDWPFMLCTINVNYVIVKVGKIFTT